MPKIYKYDKINIGGSLLYTDVNGNFIIENNLGQTIFNSSSLDWSPNKFLDLVAWYDASDTSTIVDSSGIVSQFNDKSGNGFDLTVITAGKSGPKTGSQNLNGLNVLSWDDINQILENDSFSYDQSSSSLYLSAVFRCDQDNSQDFIIAGTESVSNGERMGLRRISPHDSLQILGGSGTGSNIPLTSPDDSAKEGEDLIFTVKFNSSNSFISINGVIEVSGDIGTNQFTSLNIGGNAIESSNINGYIAELIFFTDSSKVSETEGYLAHKWKLTDNLPQSHLYKVNKP